MVQPPDAVLTPTRAVAQPRVIWHAIATRIRVVRLTLRIATRIRVVLLVVRGLMPTRAGQPPAITHMRIQVATQDLEPQRAIATGIRVEVLWPTTATPTLGRQLTPLPLMPMLIHLERLVHAGPTRILTVRPMVLHLMRIRAGLQSVFNHRPTARALPTPHSQPPRAAAGSDQRLRERYRLVVISWPSERLTRRRTWR